MKTIKRTFEELVDMPSLEHPYYKEIVQRNINAHHCAVKIGFKSGQTEMFEMSIEKLEDFIVCFRESQGNPNEKGAIADIEGAEEVHGLDFSQIAYFKVTDWVGEDVEE